MEVKLKPIKNSYWCDIILWLLEHCASVADRERDRCTDFVCSSKDWTNICWKVEISSRFPWMWVMSLLLSLQNRGEARRGESRRREEESFIINICMQYINLYNIGHSICGTIHNIKPAYSIQNLCVIQYMCVLTFCKTGQIILALQQIWQCVYHDL